MSAKAIREITGKGLLAKHLPAECCIKVDAVTVTAETLKNWDAMVAANPWVKETKLVVKPDNLVKRRGKLGLVKVNASIEEVKQWVEERMGTLFNIGAVEGRLDVFIIEPFVAHNQADEYYISIYSEREQDVLLFYHEGGIDVGDVDEKAVRLCVEVGKGGITAQDVLPLLEKVPEQRRAQLSTFIVGLYEVYVRLYFTYLEINPLVMVGTDIFVLDLAAKLDQTAEFEVSSLWGAIDWPPPFGRDASPEEAYIASLDAKTGASLKLTILNKMGRIWTMVAGGGASVIYSDTICEMGGASELANYGEYSGAPSESQTYEYAKTILDLMTRSKHPQGKVLIIGGGIANFTNVALTFKGIVRALVAFQPKLVEHNVSIFVRRGGPNYQEGLKVMEELGMTLEVPIYVYGPETHMTSIVGMALGLKEIDSPDDSDDEVRAIRTRSLDEEVRPRKRTAGASRTASRGSMSGSFKKPPPGTKERLLREKEKQNNAEAASGERPLFSADTQALVWGMQPRAVQGMLDFDYSCRREKPSVAAMVYPFSGNHMQRFYWGAKEILIPVFKKLADAVKQHPDADVLVNFASLRSAFASTMETLDYPQIRTIAIIAEGIPENRTRAMIKAAAAKGVTVIGPATVGGIKPGCFKIGNTGGMLDNIITSKLYRSGSVAYVSRSGGMSNELNNIVSRATNGVYEGVAIGGDRYPGTTFIDHLLRYERDPNIKMLILLGEVGGTEEYRVCEALKAGLIKKPLVAWCIGTCAGMFGSEVQFGHAGSCAQADRETSVAKNIALREAGARVPKNFDELKDTVKVVYRQLVEQKVVVEEPEPEPPTVPVDYSWAQELGLIRKPTTFMSTIVDDRGEELLYAGMPLSKVFSEDMGIGGVLSLIWFKRRLPAYASKFIEMCLMITADHGPAVSGAHNTIVCARAGKDLVSSLASGLLTIGPRFGGALDDAADMFSKAYDSGLSPMEFVNKMRADAKLIMGIGHRIKSLNNPDMRVTIIKDFCMREFPSNTLLDYALKVEAITTSKKANLILNVDGCMAVCFVDLLRNCGVFTAAEAEEYVNIGTLNGLFVLGRSLGFIGHYLDQKRLKQGLYRHPTEDISYALPEWDEMARGPVVGGGSGNGGNGESAV